ncbi:MAG: LysR family transcriptional regulator [Albidovulum sp.]|jgi:DNA-binding transcriptional LysR family regulator
MRLEWIEDILAVLETGSLVRAAERRLLTQSAFTRRIQLIEDLIGATLFDRSRKPVTLMPGVRALEPELRDAGAQLRRLRLGLRAAANQTQGAFSFACQHAITTTVSPWIVRALTADEHASVRVRSGNRDECLMLLLAGDVDFAVMYELPEAQAPLHRRACETVTIGHDLLIPVCAPALHDLVLSDSFPMISYPSDVFLGQVFDRNIAPKLRESITHTTKAETALTLAALHYATRGIGVAWLPELTVADSLAQGQLMRLDDHLPSQMLEIRMLRLSGPQARQSDAVWLDILSDMKLPERI